MGENSGFHRIEYRSICVSNRYREPASEWNFPKYCPNSRVNTLITGFSGISCQIHRNILHIQDIVRLIQGETDDGNLAVFCPFEEIPGEMGDLIHI